VTSSHPAISTSASPKTLSGAAGVGIGIAAAVGFIALAAIGFWLYRQGRVSQAMAYRRHVERLSIRQDQEASHLRSSVPSRNDDGFSYRSKCNEYDHDRDYPIQLAELMGSAPDNMMI
jgi:hypothetical protein